MTTVEQIEKAIGAHGMWKARLRQAIDTGKSDFDPTKVKTDNNCDFANGFTNEISPELKLSEHYKTIIKYHAEFIPKPAEYCSLP